MFAGLMAVMLSYFACRDVNVPLLTRGGSEDGFIQSSEKHYSHQYFLNSFSSVFSIFNQNQKFKALC